MQTLHVRNLQGGEWVDAHLKPRKVASLRFEWSVLHGLWREVSTLCVTPDYIKLDILRGCEQGASCVSKGWDVSSVHGDRTVETAIKWFRNKVLSNAHRYATLRQIEIHTRLADDSPHNYFSAHLMIVPYTQSADTLIVPNI